MLWKFIFDENIQTNLYMLLCFDAEFFLQDK